jgi:hypothetical protein
MKKGIMALVIMLTMGSISAFAGDEIVNEKVLNAFKQDFSNVMEVRWTECADYYKAEFAFNNQQLSAFYNTSGELIGISRYLTSTDLPLNLLINLKKDYLQYWITDLFEVGNKDGTSYYITLEDADTKIMLKASDGYNWTSWKKTKKS